MEGNESVNQLDTTVSRITGEGRAVFSRAWDSGLDQEGAGGRGGGVHIYIWMSSIDKFQYKEAA